MYSMKKGGSSKSSKQQAAIAMSMKAAGKKPKMAMGGPGPKYSSSEAAASAKKAADSYRNKMNLQQLNQSNPTYIVDKTTGKFSKMKMGGSCGTPRRLKK